MDVSLPVQHGNMVRLTMTQPSEVFEYRSDLSTALRVESSQGVCIRFEWVGAARATQQPSMRELDQ
jgi:hypothetical protein